MTVDKCVCQAVMPLKDTPQYRQKIDSSVKCSDRFKQSLYIPDGERQNKSADVANEETVNK